MQENDQDKKDSSLDAISKSLRKVLAETAIAQAKFAAKLNRAPHDVPAEKAQDQAPKESMDAISKRLRGLIEASKPIQEKLAAKMNRDKKDCSVEK